MMVRRSYLVNFHHHLKDGRVARTGKTPFASSPEQLEDIALAFISRANLRAYEKWLRDSEFVEEWGSKDRRIYDFLDSLSRKGSDGILWSDNEFSISVWIVDCEEDGTVTYS